jgi:molybdate transport system ATP-binding protein
LRVTVLEIGAPDGPSVFVKLALGEERLLARLTTRSVAALGLRAGLECHAMIKAVSLATQDITQRA